MTRELTSFAGARWFAIIAVALVALAAGGLSALAYQRANPTVDAGEFTPAPALTPGTTATPSPTANDPAPAPIFGDSELFLSIGSDSWWRASGGACTDEPPVLERSSDEGASWSDVTPAYRGVAQIAGLDAIGGTEARIVAGVGADCTVEALRTFTQGEYWESYADLLASASYVDLEDPAWVVLPSGEIEAPCAHPVGLRSDGVTSAVLCDGAALARGDDTEWAALADDARAVSVDDQGIVVANVTADCAGLTVTRFSEATPDSAAPLGCAAGISASDPVAIDTSDDRVFIWAGETITTLP